MSKGEMEAWARIGLGTLMLVMLYVLWSPTQTWLMVVLMVCGFALVLKGIRFFQNELDKELKQKRQKK